MIIFLDFDSVYFRTYSHCFAPTVPAGSGCDPTLPLGKNAGLQRTLQACAAAAAALPPGCAIPLAQAVCSNVDVSHSCFARCTSGCTAAASDVTNAKHGDNVGVCVRLAGAGAAVW